MLKESIFHLYFFDNKNDQRSKNVIFLFCSQNMILGTIFKESNILLVKVYRHTEILLPKLLKSV